MAVDHAQRARWVSRVLRLRQAGLPFSLKDVQATATDITPDARVDEPHSIGGEGHPLTGIIGSFNDLGDDDKYIEKLFDMDIDELIDESRKETTTAHEQMVADGFMEQADVDACYDSQDEDETVYVEQAEEKLSTGDWPVPHRLGHGYAMTQEVDA